MRVIIVEDDPVATTILSKLLDEEHTQTEVVGSFKEATAALEFLADNSVDAIFLDIELPDLSGIDLAGIIDDSIHIVVVSSSEEYAFEAFQLNVVDYILKPITKKRLYKSLLKLQKLVRGNTNSMVATNCIFIKKNDSYQKIRIEEIVWIESDADYVVIHTGSERFYMKATMKEILDKLPSGHFARIHRSYIAAVDKITEFNDFESTLRLEGVELPVSKTYRGALKKELPFL